MRYEDLPDVIKSLFLKEEVAKIRMMPDQKTLKIDNRRGRTFTFIYIVATKQWKELT